MEKALIVSYSEKGVEIVTEILKSISCKDVSTVKTCGEARRMALEKNFDLYIINSPVYTESGEDLARELIATDTAQVILLVKNEVYDYMSNTVEDLGVITIAKPLNKSLLRTSLKLAKATFSRLEKMQSKNIKLTQKIDDIKIIDRAKCVLISHLSMNESDAHKYIEKKAMNSRSSRREIAETILKTYEE